MDGDLHTHINDWHTQILSVSTLIPLQNKNKSKECERINVNTLKIWVFQSLMGVRKSPHLIYPRLYTWIMEYF